MSNALPEDQDDALGELHLLAPPEVDRINVEPAILLGLSSSEASWAIGIAFAVWTPISALLTFLWGGFPLFVLLALVLPMASVWIGAKQMAKVKRNRPDLYYVHALTAWAARAGLRRSRFISHVGQWDLGRSFASVSNKAKGR